MKKALQQQGYDQLDIAILEELQINGRTSVADLARRIHLSQPAVHNRIKRLERDGIIQQYVTLLNQKAVGYDLMCFVQVRLASHQADSIDTLKQTIQAMVRVLECFLVAGQNDMILKIVVENQQALNNFISNLVSLDAIDRIESSVVLEEIKLTTALSLE
ncbi:MAG: Lrp/AsnC ligand binding domain-containing protein [Phototrophicaceae bacterium]